jgi:hypothetical protein
MSRSPILPFYRRIGTDHRGRTLDEIRRLDLDRLESTHDYIQWLFPLPEPSRALPVAPMLTASDIAAFHGDPALRDELRRSFEVMLGFYGLRERGGDISPTAEFGERSLLWLYPMNHNHLRLTRIMRSMSLLGCRPEALALQEALLAIVAAHPDGVTPATVESWRGAVPEKQGLHYSAPQRARDPTQRSR